jgi:hypothetical protein
MLKVLRNIIFHRWTSVVMVYIHGSPSVRSCILTLTWKQNCVRAHARVNLEQIGQVLTIWCSIVESKVQRYGFELYHEVNAYCVLPPRGRILTMFLCVLLHAQNTVRVNTIWLYTLKQKCWFWKKMFVIGWGRGRDAGSQACELFKLIFFTCFVFLTLNNVYMRGYTCWKV